MAELTSKPSPVQARLTLLQHLALASYWFAFNALWGALLYVVIPKHAELLEARGLLSLFGSDLDRRLFGHALDKAAAEGIALGIGSIVAAAAPPVIGAISDRCCSRFGRRRPFIFWGTAMLLAGLWGQWSAFQAGSFPAYVLAFLVVELGANVGAGAYSGIIPDIVPAAERGTASGWMAVMIQLGTITGATIAGFAPEQGRLPLLAVIGLFAVFTLVGVRERPIARAVPFRARDLLLCFWVNPVRYPDFAWLWVSRAAVTFGVYLIVPFLLYYLADVVGVRDLRPRPWEPQHVVPIWMATALVAATPMGLIGARISDRVGRRIVVCIATLVMAGVGLGFILVGALPSPEARLAAVMALSVLWGLGYGAFASVDWALGTEVLPHPEDAAKDMGVWHLSMTVPMMFAPITAGALILTHFKKSAGVTGYRPAGYAVEFVLAALFLAAGALLVFKIRKVR
ncbi:MAG: MFS transporter [Armatimonadetes bacterium]|nr:MFS transporter [Armatimonadota bacterium]